MMRKHETALVILVPEAERVVGVYRGRYDPSAADGIPPHITILYPFLAEEKLTDQVLKDLGTLFREHSQFDVTFPRIRPFQQSLWLDPEPVQPLCDLIEAVATRFPNCPPYGDVQLAIPPHLTTAILASDAQRERVHREFMEISGSRLPVHTRVTCVSLMIKRAGSWSESTSFPLRQI